jgi:cell division control protein 11
LNQIIRRKKNAKKGTQFSLMVCGTSGTGMSNIKPRAGRVPTRKKLTVYTGRTTFINMLCGHNVLEHADSDAESGAHPEQGLQIKSVTVGMFAIPVPQIFFD